MHIYAWTHAHTQKSAKKNKTQKQTQQKKHTQFKKKTNEIRLGYIRENRQIHTKCCKLHKKKTRQKVKKKGKNINKIKKYQQKTNSKLSTKNIFFKLPLHSVSKNTQNRHSKNTFETQKHTQTKKSKKNTTNKKTQGTKTNTHTDTQKKCMCLFFV